jgi:uncharacterized protein YegP (UPF0339 family)
MSQITITKTADDKFIFTLSDSNQQVLFTSVGYSTMPEVRQAIAVLQNRAAQFPNFERKKTPTNKMYFVIRTKDGRIIGDSEKHASIAALENSINAVNQSATKAPIVDASSSQGADCV